MKVSVKCWNCFEEFETELELNQFTEHIDRLKPSTEYEIISDYSKTKTVKCTNCKGDNEIAVSFSTSITVDNYFIPF